MNENISPKSKEVRPTARRGGGFARFLNVVLILAIVAVGVLFVRAEQNRREVQKQLEQTANELQEAKNNSEQAGAALAEEVLGKVRRHLDVPTEPAPTVATITDVDKLKESNDFYQPAKNGDHLIITEKRAILYDADRDMILDVVPVQITPNTEDQNQVTGDQPGSSITPLPESPAVSPVTPTPTSSPLP